MKILVTGADGQLGHALRDALEERLPAITTYLTRSDLDLSDREAVATFISIGQYTHIINCVAYTAVDAAESEPQKCRTANIDIVGNLASAARDNEARMMHISTDYVFDGERNTPYTEADRVNPLSEYGRAKRRGEMLLMDLAPDAIIIRTSGLYSPWRHNFIKTMLELARKGVKPRVVVDQICTPTYARDLAEAITDILRSSRWIGGIYNYSNLGVTSWYDIAVEVFRFLGYPASYVTPILSREYAAAAARPPYSVLDKKLICSTYGLSIPYWRDSLERCLKELTETNDKD